MGNKSVCVSTKTKAHQASLPENSFSKNFDELLPESFYEEKNFRKYVSDYLEKSEKNLKLLNEYIDKILNCELFSIMKTLFMVDMVLKTLPFLDPNNRINKFTIYAVMMQQLINDGVNQLSNEEKRSSTEEYFELAFKMAEIMISKGLRNDVQNQDAQNILNYDPNKQIKEQKQILGDLKVIFPKFSCEGEAPNEKICLNFAHPSFRDFFLAQNFISMCKNSKIPEWISKKLIVEESELILFIAETIKYDKPTLFDLKSNLFATRNEDSDFSCVKAANLITIMNAANFPFIAQDFRKIRINGANLNDGVFSECDFSEADLNNVSLKCCKLSGSNFSNTKLIGAKLNFYPLFTTSVEIQCALFSQSGKFLIAGSNEFNFVFDLKNFNQLKSMMINKDESNKILKALALSPQENKIVNLYSDGPILISDFQNGEILHKVELKYFRISRMQFINDNELILLDYDGAFKLNTHDGKVLQKYSLEEVGIPVPNFTTYYFTLNVPKCDTQAYYFTNEKEFTIYHLENKASFRCKFNGTIHNFLFSNQGNIIVAISLFGNAQLWDVNSGTKILEIQSSLKGKVKSLMFSPDDSQLLVHKEETNGVVVYRLSDGKVVRCLELHKAANFVAFSNNGDHFIIAYQNSNLRIWDTFEKNEVIKSFDNYFSLGISTCAFSMKKDKIALASDNGDIHILTYDSELFVEKNIQFLRGSENSDSKIVAVTFNDDGTLLATADFGKKITIWDLPSKKMKKRTIPVQKDQISDIFFGNKGKILICILFQRLVIFDIETGKTLNSMKIDSNFFSISCLNNYLAIEGLNHSIEIWNINLKKKLKTLNGHQEQIYRFEFSVNEELLTSCGSDNTIRVWSLQDLKEIFCIQTEKENIIEFIHFCHQDQLLLTFDRQRNVKVYDLGKMECVRNFTIHWNITNSVSIDYIRENDCIIFVDKFKIFFVDSKSGYIQMVLGSRESEMQKKMLKNLNGNEEILKIFNENDNDFDVIKK